MDRTPIATTALLLRIFSPKQTATAFLLMAMVLLCGQNIKASHLAGGELSYTHVSGLTYNFTLTLYRDCSGIPLQQNLLLDVSIANCSTLVNDTIHVNQVGPTVENTGCGPGLSTCQNGTLPGIEMSVYSGTYTFSVPCQNWIVSYDICCRPNSTNLSVGSASDFFISAEINNNFQNNSSPVFNPVQNPFGCVNAPQTFDFSAVDPDGDTLSYALVPAQTTNGPANYSSPYGPTYPISSTTNSVNFDPVTGQMNFTPDGIGTYVAVVEVSEWRNGILLSKTRRDIIIPVITCQAGYVCGSNVISGTVFHDVNSNCVNDGGDFPLGGWLMEATPGPFYTLTNALGYYEFHVDSGTYVVKEYVNNANWSQTCPPTVGSTYSVYFNGTNLSDPGNDFGNEPDFLCPVLHVNLAPNQLRPCNPYYYNVNYCNYGTDSAIGATVDVTIPSNFTVTYNTGTLISSNHPTYTFDVGDLGIGDCGFFKIGGWTPCDSSLMGQTVCATAHIYPDSICLPVDTLWDRSSVQVTGACQGDSLVCFTITNTGSPSNGNMAGPSDWRLYENNALILQGTFQLCGGCDTTLCFTANGNTLRLEADQRPGHPGNSHPNEVIELCGTPGDTVGLVNSLPTDDADHFVDINCTVVVNSWDPNDKQAFPVGLAEQHFIQKNGNLEYIIRFQNTGTAAAIDVAIEDTLDLNVLDITTMVPGASSHTVSNFQIHGAGVLRWEFDGINLPDSGANFEASQGFVQFNIKQKPNLQVGTVINNRGAIIFDKNAEIVTNNPYRTIGEAILLTVNPLTLAPRILINAYPNPMHTSTTVKVSGLEGHEPVTVSLFTLMGQELRRLDGRADQAFVLQREGLASGIYVFTVRSGETLLGSGKLLISND